MGSFKCRMCQKQRRMARAYREGVGRLNKPQKKLTEKRENYDSDAKVKSSSIASKSQIWSTSRSAPAMYIDKDGEQSTKSQPESESRTP